MPPSSDDTSNNNNTIAEQLDQLQQSLAQSIATAKHHRDLSVGTRKVLVDCTKQLQKQLKSTESGELEALTKTVIQHYRDAIDQLTKRCKAAESSVVSVQSTLMELDVGTELQQHHEHVQQLLQTVATLTQEVEAANERSQSATAEAPSSSNNNNNNDSEELEQLRKELAEYELEFRSLKNQDITIRKLEDRISELQHAAATALDQAVSQVQLESESQLHAATEQLHQQLAQAQAQASQYQVQWQSELAFREATQSSLHQTDNVVAQREAAWDAQRQLLQDEVARLQEQVALSSRGVGPAPMSGNSAVGRGGSSGMTDEAVLERNAYEAELAELADTNTALRNELRQAVAEQEQRVAAYTKELETAQREREELSATLQTLQTQVASAPDATVVAAMQRELRILKHLEYNTTDEEMEPANDAAETLEAVLVAKLRKAEQDLIAERNESQRLQASHTSMQQALHEAEQAKEASGKLVATLEQDLETAIQQSQAAVAAPSKQSKASSGAPSIPRENPSTLQNILDPKSGAVAATTTPVATAVAVPAPPPSPPSSAHHDDHSVATIVMAQRDRLRARCDALEAERDSFKRELQAQVQAAESYQSDNAKLYEKVRYLQNFAGSGANSRGNASRDLDLEALEQRYEASVDPFRQFSKTERQRKLKEMSPMERTVYVVARTVLSTKEMRTGLFFYVLALHLLVFFTTYHWSAAGCHNTASADMETLSLIAPHVQEHLISHKEQAVAGGA